MVDTVDDGVPYTHGRAEVGAAGSDAAAACGTG